MASKYTANDFRNAANYVETYDVFEEHDREIANMLLHAAEMMAREEREKKYEYAIIWDYDNSLCEMSIFHDYIKKRMDEINSDGVACHLVRREVGEWEEVSNG